VDSHFAAHTSEPTALKYGAGALPGQLAIARSLSPRCLFGLFFARVNAATARDTVDSAIEKKQS